MVVLEVLQGMLYMIGVLAGAVAILTVSFYISCWIMFSIEDGIDKIKRSYRRKYS